MTHIFNHTRWKVKSQNGLPRHRLGECQYDLKTIKIPIYGDTSDDLDTCIHESLHASCPFLDEDTVEQTATEIALLLWKLKWRREE